MNYMEKYEEWLNSSFIDDDIKEELKNISDAKEIEDRFYKDLEFGTGGMRGIMGAGTNRMNKHIISKATQGFANYINSNYNGEKSFVIAHDSRNNSKEFTDIAACVLASSGIKTYLFNDLRSTPELSYAVRELGCSAGIVITASHNPPEYNGYKVYGNYGCQLLPDVAEELINEIKDVEFKDITTVSYKTAVESGMIVELGNELDDKFIELVKTVSLTDDIDKNINIVYTPLHGTGNIPVRRVLKERGFKNIHLVEEQLLPDPNFSTVKYPNPEDEQAFELAYKKAIEVDADIIIANDPDCDRLGLAVKESKGKYVLLSGNQVGPLLMNYMLTMMKETNRMPLNPVVIKTVVTSNLGKVIAEYHGAECIETLTGFKFIGEKMEEYANSKEKNYVFGYEESIGYLIGTFVRDKDAVTSSMIACEMAAYYKKKGSNILLELEKIYQKHGYFVDGLKSIRMEGLEGNNKILSIMEYFRNTKIDLIDEYKVLYSTDYQNCVTKFMDPYSETSTGLPKSNALKYVLDNNAWFILRPSGTEPKIKIYFYSMDKNKEKANEVYNKMTEYVFKLIENI